jgi:uncharacterized membrane protein
MVMDQGQRGRNSDHPRRGLPARLALLGSLAWVGLAGCGDVEKGGTSNEAGDSGAGGGDGLPSEECSAEEAALSVSWTLTTEPILLTYCSSCHAAGSPNRYGAPEGVTFDNEAEARQWAPRVRARVIVDQDMPVGGGVFDEDARDLEAWLDCGDTI